jgi:hypothetical protein
MDSQHSSSDASAFSTSSYYIEVPRVKPRYRTSSRRPGAGNKHVRCLMVQHAWSWLRNQPASALTAWYKRSSAAAVVASAALALSRCRANCLRCGAAWNKRKSAFCAKTPPKSDHLIIDRPTQSTMSNP